MLGRHRARPPQSIRHMSTTTVTRFAPSPTGELHLGGLRTALFSYALARRDAEKKEQQGRFLLRIEDTDQARTVVGSEDRLVDALARCGLKHDGVRVRQSERVEIYARYAKQLVDNGHAYPCFCTRERLDQLRKIQREDEQTGTRYDGKCRTVAKETAHAWMMGEKKKPYTIRLKAPQRRLVVKDAVLGDVWFPPDAIDDQILIKADGWPTYHLASVIDDHDMGITHVARGEEWLSSTPKHLMLYEAFGWTPPIFAHLPLLLTSDGKKLSKRSAMGMSVVQLLDEGYLPSTLVNFCATLGWSSSATTQRNMVMTLADICKEFSLDRVSKGAAMVDENRLFWLNGMHIRRVVDLGQGNNEEYELLCGQVMKGLGRVLGNSGSETAIDRHYLHDVMKLLKERANMPDDFVKLGAHFFMDHVDTPLFGKLVSMDKAKDILGKALDLIETDKMDELDMLHESLGMQKKQVLSVLRIALTGIEVGAPLPGTVKILSKDKAIKRLKGAMMFLAH